MRKQKRWAILSVIVAVVILIPALFACAPKQTEVINWKMHGAYADTHYFTLSWKSFAQEVMNRTNGQLAITVYPSSALGFGREAVLTSLRDNIVPIAEISCSASEGVIAEFKQITPFYILESAEMAEKAFEPIRDDMEKMVLDKFNVKILAACTGTSTELHLKKKINTLDDIKGLKVRTMGPAMAKQAEMLGIVPTSVSGKEVVIALERGIVDGLYTSVQGVYTMNCYPYITTTNFVGLQSSKFLIGVNNDVFNSLPSSIQKELVAAGKWLEEEEYNEIRDLDWKNSYDALLGHGIVMHTPPQAVLSAMRDVGRRLAEETAAEFGDAGKDRLARMLKAIGVK